MLGAQLETPLAGASGVNQSHFPGCSHAGRCLIAGFSLYFCDYFKSFPFTRLFIPDAPGGQDPHRTHRPRKCHLHRGPAARHHQPLGCWPPTDSPHGHGGNKHTKSPRHSKQSSDTLADPSSTGDCIPSALLPPGSPFLCPLCSFLSFFFSK